MWSIQQLVYSCILNQGQHHIVFKEYQQAETVAWNQYLHTIPEGMVESFNKSTLTITFKHFNATVKFPHGIEKIEHDTSKPPSTIRLLGSDKADSHRGGESNGMIFDEYQDQDPYNWDTVYKPFFATTGGWACFMGTAKDKDHWNELLDRSQESDRWYYSKATWRENPLIKPEWVAEERSEAEKEEKLGPFLQEMELIPYHEQGAVYPMFKKDIHVIKPSDVPEDGTDYVALDFGFAEGHPMAAAFIRITHDDIWYQYDEIHRTGLQIDELVEEIRTKMGERRLTMIVADSARPDLIDYMTTKGLPVVPSPKGGGNESRIVSGIALLRKRLKPKIQIIGDPKPNYYVTSNCKGTIYDWTHYRYKEVKTDRPPSEKPDKKHDDAMDAIRYLELFFKYGVPSDDNVPESSMVNQFNDYGLL
ncbi:MAG: hypothetical protein ACXABY_30145 [Candidatus Thorarchaeota archaeon]